MKKLKIGTPIIDNVGQKWYPVIFVHYIELSNYTTVSGKTIECSPCDKELSSQIVEYFQTRKECENYIKRSSAEKGLPE
jgi:hypothetical protein